MALLHRVAKAGVLRDDGKVFNAEMLKLHAKESPDQYVYFEAQEELWAIKPEEKKPDAHVS